MIEKVQFGLRPAHGINLEVVEYFLMRASWILIVGILLIIAIAFTAIYSSFSSHADNADNRESLLQIHDAIELNDDARDVLTAYWDHRTDSLRLHANSSDEWHISMPLEFGAKDWRLGNSSAV